MQQQHDNVTSTRAVAVDSHTVAPSFLTQVCLVGVGWAAVATTDSSFAGIFFIYWFQDEVGQNGFSLLGRHITDAPQTALAFTSTISQITGFVLTAPGGWVADRFPYLPRTINIDGINA